MRFTTFFSRIFATISQPLGNRPDAIVLKTGLGAASLLMTCLLMASPAPAGSMPVTAGTGLDAATRHWLTEHGVIRPVGMAECKSNSDCAKGEICCKVSAMESFCADPDECFVARPAPHSSGR